MTDKTVISENSRDSVAALFPKRSPLSNKGDFGTAYIVGGSANYVGAPTFSLSSASEILLALGKATMLSGAGRNALVVPDFLADALYPSLKFSAVYPVKSVDGVMCFDEKSLSVIKGKGACAVGMGAGSADFLPLLKRVADNPEMKCVIDADALKSISSYSDVMRDLSGRVVLTPHVGEFSAMTGLKINEIKANACELAREYAEKFGAVLVLKDSVSYISDGTRVVVNRTGNAKLSKGGSGDVLSGIICGMLAWGASPLDASRAGAYILGRCAELSPVNEYSFLPTDAVDKIPAVIDELINNLR